MKRIVRICSWTALAAVLLVGALGVGVRLDPRHPDWPCHADQGAGTLARGGVGGAAAGRCRQRLGERRRGEDPGGRGSRRAARRSTRRRARRPRTSSPASGNAAAQGQARCWPACSVRSMPNALRSWTASNGSPAARKALPTRSARRPPTSAPCRISPARSQAGRAARRASSTGTRGFSRTAPHHRLRVRSAGAIEQRLFTLARTIQQAME